jgi:hypothetical protein
MIRPGAISARVAKPQYIVRIILGDLAIRFGLTTGLRIVAPLAGPLRIDRMRMRVRMRIAPLGARYSVRLVETVQKYAAWLGLPDGRQICALVWFIVGMAFRRDFRIALCCTGLRYVQVRLEDYVLRRYLIVLTIRHNVYSSHRCFPDSLAAHCTYTLARSMIVVAFCVI